MEKNNLNCNKKIDLNQILDSLKNNPAFFNNKDILNNISNSDFNLINYIVSTAINSIMLSERNIYLKNNTNEIANGFYHRSLNTKADKINLSVPRTDTKNFRPKILPPKYKRYIDDYKDLVVNLIIAGNSKSQIGSILNANGQIYSKDAIDQIYDDLTSRLEDFKSRDLPSDLACVFIDGKYIEIKVDNKVQKAVLYILLGISFDGSKQILGFYVMFGNESAEKWKSIFVDLINRKLKRVLLFICDNLSGLTQTINALFPKADIQLCIIHLMRNGRRNMKKEDAKEFNSILKSIKDESALFDDNYYKNKLCEFIKNKKTSYVDFLTKLEKDLPYYLSFLNYPQKLRKHIYSTNAVESINNQIEKIRVRQEGYFQSLNNLELNIFILSNKLLLSWNKKLQPFFIHHSYELKQLFNLKYL
jgi:transposase-like protein